MKKESKKTLITALVVSAGIIAIAIPAGILSERKGSSPPAPSPAKEAPAPVVEKPDLPENKDPAVAFYAARMFLEKQLKAPASAKWPGFGDEGTAASFVPKSQLWIVKGYVDSQNSYGALIRTLYVMSLEYIPGEGWKMNDLSTEP